MTIEEHKLGRLLLTPREAAAVLGIGRSMLYELLRTGETALSADRLLPAHRDRRPVGSGC